jgi:hypothetical protein
MHLLTGILQIAVSTVKYLVELRGWNGIALPAVHSRDAKIYIDDPGPWIMGLATEARYSIRPAPDVCICDLYVPRIPKWYLILTTFLRDINYVYVDYTSDEFCLIVS